MERLAAQIIVILSRQRSSSSFLSTLLGGNQWNAEEVGAFGPCLQCTTNFNEITRRGVADQDNGASKLAGGTHKDWDLLRYAHAVRNASCERDAHGCQGACAIVFKLFDAHGVHKWQLRALLQHTRTAAILLERNASDELCSKLWAVKSNDYGITPMHHELNHKQTGKNLSITYAEYRHTCPPPSRGFEAGHAAWFDLIRLTLRELGRPSLELRFDEVTTNTSDVLRRISSFVSLPPELPSPDCAVARASQVPGRCHLKAQVV